MLEDWTPREVSVKQAGFAVEFFPACHSVRSKFTVSVSYYARCLKNCGKLAKHMAT